MAIDITINLSDAREATLVRMTAEYNTIERSIRPSWVDVTPAQYFRQYSRDHIDSKTSLYSERDKLSLREKYNLATSEERAQIDAILAPYSL